MTKIAIFGDSFAYPNIVRKQPKWASWPQLILEKYGEENVYNFALNGTGFWYSYNQYKLHGEKYDKVIFVISNTDRVWIDDKDIEPEWARHVSPEWTQGRWKNFIQQDTNATLKMYLKELDNYYMLFHNRLKEEEFCRLATKDLKSILGDNILFLNCFEDEMPFSNPGQTVSLKWFMDEEEKHWKIDYYGKEHVKYYDGRLCHMAQENNIMLFNKVDKWLQTGNFDLTKLDFKPPMKPWSDYAISWKDLKDADLG